MSIGPSIKENSGTTYQIEPSFILRPIIRYNNLESADVIFVSIETAYT